MKRGALVACSVLFIGLSMSSFLAISGFTIWEWKRYGHGYLILYGLDGALTFPAHLAAGLKGGGSGGGEDGIPVRVWSVIGAAVFWGAGAGLADRLHRSRWRWAVLAGLAFMAAWSGLAGYRSTTAPI